MKNIITFNIKKAMLVIAVISVISACKDNEIEKKFDKPYAERVEAQIEELRNTLMDSEHGWRTLYFTDKDGLPGFNFIFKFTGENTVEMASDFSAADTVFRSSEYTIKDASTVKLSFITQNVIHRLSDSGNSPTRDRGAGYKGDFEFLYYGKAENGEDLIFRGNKTNGNPDDNVEIRFVKAESSELIRTIFENKIKIGSLLAGSETSVYRRLSVVKNGVKTRFSYDYNSMFTFLDVSAENDAESFFSFIYFTENGFVINRLKTGVDEFIEVEIPLSSYDAPKDQFTVNIEDGTVILGSGAAPLQPVNGHKEIIDPDIINRLSYFHRDEDLPAGLTTSGFEELYEAANATGFAFFNDMVVGGAGPEKRDFFLIIIPDGEDEDEDEENIISLYTYDDQSDRIVFIYDGDLSILPSTDGQRALLDFLFDDEGFYVENLGAVTQFRNHIYTFTSVKNPSIRVAFYGYEP